MHLLLIILAFLPALSISQVQKGGGGDFSGDNLEIYPLSKRLTLKEKKDFGEKEKSIHNTMVLVLPVLKNIEKEMITSFKKCSLFEVKSLKDIYEHVMHLQGFNIIELNSFRVECQPIPLISCLEQNKYRLLREFLDKPESMKILQENYGMNPEEAKKMWLFYDQIEKSGHGSHS